MEETATDLNEAKNFEAHSADSDLKVSRPDIKSAGNHRLPHEVLTQIMTAYLQFLKVQRSA